MGPSGEFGGWNPHFSRSFNDWELDQVCNFVENIQDLKVHPEKEDRIVWNLSREGCFSVKSLYGDLEGLGMGPFPRKLIWNPDLPSKVSFFAWEVWWGRILTLDQLKKKG